MKQLRKEEEKIFLTPVLPTSQISVIEAWMWCWTHSLLIIISLPVFINRNTFWVWARDFYSQLCSRKGRDDFWPVYMSSVLTNYGMYLEKLPSLPFSLYLYVFHEFWNILKIRICMYTQKTECENTWENNCQNLKHVLCFTLWLTGWIISTVYINPLYISGESLNFLSDLLKRSLFGFLYFSFFFLREKMA